MKLLNLDNLNEPFICRDESGLFTELLGAAAGSQKIYVNIDHVPPQTFSTRYHSHSEQEEFFLILQGSGVLRFNDAEYPIQKGDFLAKIPAQNNAHTFYNSSDDTLIILDVGTVQKEDTCYYPDDDIYLQKSQGEQRVYSGQSLLRGWTPKITREL